MYPGSYTDGLHRHVTGGLRRTDRRRARQRRDASRRAEYERGTCVEGPREDARWM